MNVKKKVANLVKLAIEVTESGKAHAFVEYAGHVDCVSVRALPADTVYIYGSERNHIINRSFYIVESEFNSADKIADNLALAELQLKGLLNA